MLKHTVILDLLENKRSPWEIQLMIKLLSSRVRLTLETTEFRSRIIDAFSRKTAPFEFEDNFVSSEPFLRDFRCQKVAQNYPDF